MLGAGWRGFVVGVLAAAVAVAGCADDSTSGETTGSLNLSLELTSGVVVDEVRWTISRRDM